LIKKTNFALIFLIFPFIFISLFLVNEISNKLFIKEIIYIIIGIIGFLIAYLIPIRKFLWVIPFLYWINILLLFLVDLIGIKILGAQRWLKIPFIEITIQPSEFMKTTLLLMLGFLIYKNPPRPYYNLKEFLKLSFFIILPFLLIVKEPDLGTALITLIIGFGILFIVGVEKKIWIGLGVILLLFAPFY